MSTRITRPLANQRFAASDRGGNAFFPQTQAFALQKMPEMTYTPSFLMRASFFRDFVNTLRGCEKTKSFFTAPGGGGGASYPQFAMVVPHLRTVPPLSARCSVAAHCASLRVLATSALRASDVRKLTRGSPCFTGLIGGCCSHWLRRLFRPHWAYFDLFRALRAASVRFLNSQ